MEIRPTLLNTFLQRERIINMESKGRGLIKVSEGKLTIDENWLPVQISSVWAASAKQLKTDLNLLGLSLLIAKRCLYLCNESCACRTEHLFATSVFLLHCSSGKSLLGQKVKGMHTSVVSSFYFHFFFKKRGILKL